jgi:hypothetical protein
MRKLGIIRDIEEYTNEDGMIYGEGGEIYELLECLKCKKVTLRSGGWYDGMEDREWSTSIIYPTKKKPKQVQGLPDEIRKEYNAAKAVREHSANAYAVMLGRVLELVCKDRHAGGNTLYKQLEDLAQKGEIPEKLAQTAHGLRQFRNIGAHASLGSLTEEEVPFLEALCQAVLEYVYQVPLLISTVEDRLKQIKDNQQNT